MCLLQAYDLLQSVTKSKDSFDSFGQDIFVLTAEIAFQVCFIKSFNDSLNLH